MRLEMETKAKLLATRPFRSQIAQVYARLEIQQDVPNLFAIARRLDLEVVIDNCIGVDAMIGTRADNRRVVVLSRFPATPRGRFSFAHELAHEIVRREMIQPVDESGRSISLPDRLEGFCDFLAGAILMPFPRFVPAAIALATRFPDVRHNDYRALARRFHVSVSSLFVQLAILRSVHFSVELLDLGTEEIDAETLDLLPRSIGFSALWNGHIALSGRPPGPAVSYRFRQRISAGCLYVSGRNPARSRARLKCRDELVAYGAHWSDDAAALVIESTGESPRRLFLHFCRPASPGGPRTEQA
jgi:Zn-dependent peptidase ImmA (M78 family)